MSYIEDDISPRVVDKRCLLAESRTVWLSTFFLAIVVFHQISDPLHSSSSFSPPTIFINVVGLLSSTRVELRDATIFSSKKAR